MQTHDTLGLIRKMTPARMANSLRMVSSYQWSRLTGKPVVSGMPITLGVEPTTSCNLRCPECPSGLRSFTRPTGMLSTDLFDEILDQVSPTLTWLTMYFQGEPYLNPGFLAMIRSASSRNIYTSTSTNAHYLSDEAAQQTVHSGLDRLIVSIDGITQETYESYRVGGKLDKVLEGTANLIRWKRKLKSKTPHVVFQFLVVRQNEHEIPAVNELAKKLGVDQVVFKTAQIYEYQKGSPLIPDNEAYSRYRKNPDGSYEIKNKLLNQCWKMWQGSVITWDGKVVPCCFDKDASHVMGDLRSTSFRDIWYGEAYQDFRNRLLQSRDKIDICQNCTEGTRVFAN